MQVFTLKISLKFLAIRRTVNCREKIGQVINTLLKLLNSKQVLIQTRRKNKKYISLYQHWGLLHPMAQRGWQHQYCNEEVYMNFTIMYCGRMYITLAVSIQANAINVKCWIIWLTLSAISILRRWNVCSIACKKNIEYKTDCVTDWLGLGTWNPEVAGSSPALTTAWCYSQLAYTKTVDSVDGARWLARQTPNISCYLPPSNSRKNGVPVCIQINFFVVYIISLF